MSSTKGHSTPVTLTEEPEELVESRRESLYEQRREPLTEPLASSSSASRALDQPPRTPLKDRDSAGRLSGNPTFFTDPPTAHTTTFQDSTPPRFSQVVEFNSVAQTTLAAAAEMIAGDINRPDDPPTPKMTNAGSPVNQPTATGTGNNANPNASGSTSNILNLNLPRTRPNTATTSGTSGGVVNTVHYHPDRSQTLLSSSPLSPERRQTGAGPVAYDPIRGEVPIQVYSPPSGNWDGEGDPVGRQGSRDALRRMSIPRPRPVFGPTDGTVVGNGVGYGPGSRRASRMMSGNDWLPDVPVMEEPLPPREKTVEERLRPTVEVATVERDKYRKQAYRQGLLINGAIGLQIAVGAITTGVAAAATSGGNIGAAVASLGAISTILASYLAKVRGSGEPEFSTIHARELNTFLRDIEAFIMDHGHKIGTEQDDKILMYRERFELIIRTEGEDSGGGTGYSQQPLPSSHPPFAPSHPHPPPHVLVTGGLPGIVDEKQTWRNEKTINGMV